MKGQDGQSVVTTSDAWIASRYTLELPMIITQSMRVGLHWIGLCNQLGLRSGGRLVGGQDQCMDLQDCSWLVYDDCTVLRAW